VRITVASASLLSGTKPRGWNEGEGGSGSRGSSDVGIRSPDLKYDDAVGPPAVALGGDTRSTTISVFTDRVVLAGAAVTGSG
jgi:hypothetical protein